MPKHLKHLFFRNNHQNFLMVISFFLGMAFSIFVYNYWFVLRFPPETRTAFAVFLFFLLLGFLGYSYGFLKMMREKSPNDIKTRRAVFASGVIIGILSFFLGTSGWLSPVSYLVTFLPVQKLTISIPNQDANQSNLSIQWFTTSLGDVSFKDIKNNGWVIGDDALEYIPGVSQKNIEWSGKTGESANIVFKTSEPMSILVSWNGQLQTITLPSGVYVYKHSFHIPFYATYWAMIILGSLHFGLIFGVVSFCFSSFFLSLFKIEDRSAEFSSGRFEYWFIFLCVILALFIRTPFLNLLPLHSDEYSHLIAARQFLRGESVDYLRSFWIVSFPVSLSFRIFGEHLWVAKIPGVLFNVLAIFPLYLITKRINRSVALFSVLLYATNPWGIAFSNWVREYAYYPFYFYWILYFMFLFLDGVSPLNYSWKRLLNLRQLLLGLILIIPLIYSLYIDPKSTFKIIFVAYIVLFVFVAVRIYVSNGKNIWILTIVLLFLGLIGYLFLYPSQRYFTLSFDVRPALYFFPNPEQQWYFNRLSILPAMAFILSGLLAFRYWRDRPEILFLFIVFVVNVAGFTFSSVPFGGSRYLTFALLCFIPLIALGMVSFLESLKTFVDSKRTVVINVVIGLFLFLAFFNVEQSLVPITGSDNRITDTYRFDLGGVHEFLEKESTQADVLLATPIYLRHLLWKETPVFLSKELVLLDYETDDVSELIDAHQTGWLVVDVGALRDMKFDPSTIEWLEYKGNWGDMYVWKWEQITR